MVPPLTLIAEDVLAEDGVFTRCPRGVARFDDEDEGGGTFVEDAGEESWGGTILAEDRGDCAERGTLVGGDEECLPTITAGGALAEPTVACGVSAPAGDATVATRTGAAPRAEFGAEMPRVIGAVGVGDRDLALGGACAW